MAAYYNEIDPYAAQWLRNLIDAGHIAPGIVDERSIEDVHPNDLRGFTQCHFFAGVGVWSLALRRAGWSDDRPVWTGSCPCQPFSAAGAGAGFEDARHLWPTFAWLIKQCKPAIIFGEQVASKAVEPWVDLVHADLEALGYAFGAIPFPSAGVGAPHIRDRLYWMADSKSDRYEWPRKLNQSTGRDGPSHLCATGGMDNADDTRPQGHAGHGGSAERKGSDRPTTATGVFSRLEHSRLDNDANQVEAAGDWKSKANRSTDITVGSGFSPRGLADLHSDGCDQGRQCQPKTGNDGAERDSAASGMGDTNSNRSHRAQRTSAESSSDWPNRRVSIGGSGDSLPGRTAGPINGLWADADWLFCRDGKWRAVEPGTFPLAHGATSRVGRLRAYGNAINAEAATQFIAAFLEI